MNHSHRMRSARRAVCFASIVIVFLATRAEAGELNNQQRAEIMVDAQTQYDLGIGQLQSDPQRAVESFRQSAQLLDQLVEDGVRNGYLYYNLGNARLQAGEIGRAILSYRRAEQYIAGDSRLEHNLAAAREECRTQIRSTGSDALAGALLAWHRHTATTSRFTVFAAAYVAFWLLLAAHRIWRSRLWRYGAIATGLLWGVCGLSVTADLFLPRQEIGVLIEDNVILRKGDGEGFEPQVVEPLHQGVEFELIEARGQWLHVTLADHNSGWVQVRQAGLLE